MEIVASFRVHKAGLLATSQQASGRSCERPKGWRFLRRFSCV